ncbi:MAG TPA: T9SS type A sorting domain-containing protein [Saprospiraceae bacterium]|nr:T9SS type A sorting domain-containing protein [Saprospiraceae bacterium]
MAIGIDDPYDCYLPSADGCQFAGVTWVKAKTFDDGSYDNCGNVKFTIRRMSPYSDCILGLNPINGHPECDPQIDPFPDFPSEFERAITEYDSIKFYCCEVGTTQTVILRVYQTDVNGVVTTGPDGTPVFNECMIQVEVQDKIKPVCVSPANVTVGCENFDPSLWAYGRPSVYDNCCLDTTKVYQGQCGLQHAVNYSQFDTLCNRGTITRTFRVFDCHGQSSQCTQRVLVNYEQDYYVKFPDDRLITVCDGTGNYGEPQFLNKDCELLGVSYTDEVFTVVPDACYKIERTWHVINWCQYNSNLPLTVVPNPNPNATVNSPANNPGATISLSSNPNVVAAPWTATRLAIVPGATPTDYSVFYLGGTYTLNGQTITVPSIANSNGLSYKQIIKVVDTQDPVIANCPASPVTFCDLTPNDPLLWNQSYYWDNTTKSHDLCEGPADLTITATDACSGSDITIKYLLFLDLDGDGTMETVVSSTNLPGFNNVQYNNAGNAGFGGGTPYAFDNRPVPSNQKYGFALQTSVSGKNKTGSVRWNTFQSQTNYVIPELPYGTHKIKWIVEDGCGNEAICEYTFVVKDCKAPTVVCKNGLSVNIMPTGMITLWASDFLQYTEDNCTPASKIVIGIRRVGKPDGQGNITGFPRNADGTPQTSVTFTCTDGLGNQEVELWAIDLAGNADYCGTYILVQDNIGACGANATVAGVLATEATAGLEDADVQIVSGGSNNIPPVTKTDVTNNEGKYTFSKAVPFTSNATVTPSNDKNPLNGVSTYDLVLISKHILGLEPLNTPYKMIAADANKSGSITTFDIVELRKLILGIYTELPANTSWRFVDKSFVFSDPTNPFKTQFPENKTIANIQMNMLEENFVAVKVGDVNASATPNTLMQSEDRTAGTLLFDVADRSVKAGEEFEVTFKASAAAQGYQMTLNHSGLAVSEIVEGGKVSAQNFGVLGDALTVSVDGAEEFTVRFRATKSGQLSEMLGVSSRITRAEAYTLGGERQEVALRFNSGVISGVGFELYQNQPNPFVAKTVIGFHLPEASTATLTVFDESGRVLFVQKGDYAKGYNNIALDRAVVGSTGVLYYKLETSTDAATRKMIQTK